MVKHVKFNNIYFLARVELDRWRLSKMNST